MGTAIQAIQAIQAEISRGTEGHLAAWARRTPVGWSVVTLLRAHAAERGPVLRLDVSGTLHAEPDTLTEARASEITARAVEITGLGAEEAHRHARRFDDAGCRIDAEGRAAAQQVRAAVLAAFPGAI